MTYTLKTESLSGQQIKIKTNIGTLKEVWNILKDVSLDGLLTGGNLEISFTEIVDNLLMHGTLDNFISAITSDLTANVEALDLSDIVGIVTLFFTSIAQPFQGLNISVAKQKQVTKAVA